MEEGDNTGRQQRSPVLHLRGSEEVRCESYSCVEPLEPVENTLHSRQSREKLIYEENVLLETRGFEGEGGGEDVGDALRPRLNVLQAQESSMMELERHRVAEAELSETVVVLQEERDQAIRQFQNEAQRRAKQKQFSNTLLRDLDDMGKALDHSRQVAKQAKRQLVRKETEVENLINEKRALLKLIIEGGAWALWDWVKKEIVEQGLEPGEDFEKRWLTWLAAVEDVRIPTSSMPVEDQEPVKLTKDNSCNPSLATGNLQHLNSTEKDGSTGSGSVGKSSLLRTVFSIILQEGIVNLQYVLKKGLFFLPIAWFCFWMSSSTRIMWNVAGRISSAVKQSPLSFVFHIR